jgi:hypothetical protein
MTPAPQVTVQENLTSWQKERAGRYLAETRDALVESVTGLSTSQWDFRPTAMCWSIAGVTEHLALMERRIHIILSRISGAPEAPAEWQKTELDEFIVREVPRRDNKVVAPELVCPTGCWSGPEAVQHFLEGRARTAELLAELSVRGRVIPHPIFGPMDGFQWLMATAAHTARHCNQIDEIKTAADFPRA